MGSKLALGFVIPFIIVNMTRVAVEFKLNMSNPLLGTLFLLMGLNFLSLYGLMSHFTYLCIMSNADKRTQIRPDKVSIHILILTV